MSLQLPEQIKVVAKENNKATCEISPLMPGYGATIANPLRRILLSSLEGSAITSIKIKGVDHEFSTIPGVMEDVIQVILNVKRIRCRLYSDGPVKAILHVKGEKPATAADIKMTSDIEIINPEQHIATLTDKKAELEIEFEVEKGVGYVPVEQRRKDSFNAGASRHNLNSLFKEYESEFSKFVNIKQTPEKFQNYGIMGWDGNELK